MLSLNLTKLNRFFAASLLVGASLGVMSSATASPTTASISMAPMPAVGCSDSVLNGDKLEEFLTVLPETASVPIALALDFSRAAWEAQLYSGELGVGLCLPSRDRVILIQGDGVPSSLFEPEKAPSSLRDYAEAFIQWLRSLLPEN